jgi:hypothetical protein
MSSAFFHAYVTSCARGLKKNGEQDPRAVMKEKKYHMLTIAHGTPESDKR